jgi:hypothetical protein
MADINPGGVRQLAAQALRYQAKLQAVERLAEEWERDAASAGETEGMFGAISKESNLRRCASDVRKVLDG